MGKGYLTEVRLDFHSCPLLTQGMLVMFHIYSPRTNVSICVYVPVRFTISYQGKIEVSDDVFFI